jgi:hypothetical protein
VVTLANHVSAMAQARDTQPGCELCQRHRTVPQTGCMLACSQSRQQQAGPEADVPRAARSTGEAPAHRSATCGAGTAKCSALQRGLRRRRGGVRARALESSLELVAADRSACFERSAQRLCAARRRTGATVLSRARGLTRSLTRRHNPPWHAAIGLYCIRADTADHCSEHRGGSPAAPAMAWQAHAPATLLASATACRGAARETRPPPRAATPVPAMRSGAAIATAAAACCIVSTCRTLACLHSCSDAALPRPPCCCATWQALIQTLSVSVIRNYIIIVSVSMVASGGMGRAPGMVSEAVPLHVSAAMCAGCICEGAGAAASAFKSVRNCATACALA